MQLTDRINRIQISPTAAVLAEAEKLKAKGLDIADFGPGEPDFPTPHQEGRNPRHRGKQIEIHAGWGNHAAARGDLRLAQTRAAFVV